MNSLLFPFIFWLQDYKIVEKLITWLIFIQKTTRNERTAYRQMYVRPWAGF